MADVILIPGLWLDGSSWQAVIPVLEASGHTAHAITPPGMESVDADRSTVTLQDQVDAVIDVIDAVDPRSDVVVVGHSAGAAVAHAAVDARPDRISRAMYIGGFPTGDGQVTVGIAGVDGEVPLPDWGDMDDADLVDLDEAMLADFRRRAIPSPASASEGVQHLSDERRYDVPVTMICPEFTSDMLKEWMAADMEPVRELTRIRDVEYVDLPTGHWPQFTRPEDLGRIIAEQIAGTGGPGAA